MLTNDQVIFAIRKIYPQIDELQHGRTFWVAHPVDGPTQTGEAYIVKWAIDGLEEPTVEAISAAWEDNKQEFLDADAARLVRQRRDILLINADELVNRAVDEGVDASTERAYRQALRDVPQQAGFPHEIDWPVAPT